MPKPRWDDMWKKYFPKHTCPMTRHAVIISETIRDRKSPLHAAIAAYDTPPHVAESIEGTIIELWAARKFLKELGYERMPQKAGPTKWVKRDNPAPGHGDDDGE